MAGHQPRLLRKVRRSNSYPSGVLKKRKKRSILLKRPNSLSAFLRKLKVGLPLRRCLETHTANFLDKIRKKGNISKSSHTKTSGKSSRKISYFMVITHPPYISVSGDKPYTKAQAPTTRLSLRDKLRCRSAGYLADSEDHSAQSDKLSVPVPDPPKNILTRPPLDEKKYSGAPVHTTFDFEKPGHSFSPRFSGLSRFNSPSTCEAMSIKRESIGTRRDQDNWTVTSSHGSEDEESNILQTVSCTFPKDLAFTPRSPRSYPLNINRATKQTLKGRRLLLPMGVKPTSVISSAGIPITFTWNPHPGPSSGFPSFTLSEDEIHPVFRSTSKGFSSATDQKANTTKIDADDPFEPDPSLAEIANDYRTFLAAAQEEEKTKRPIYIPWQANDYGFKEHRNIGAVLETSHSTLPFSCAPNHSNVFVEKTPGSYLEAKGDTNSIRKRVCPLSHRNINSLGNHSHTNANKNDENNNSKFFGKDSELHMTPIGPLGKEDGDGNTRPQISVVPGAINSRTTAVKGAFQSSLLPRHTFRADRFKCNMNVSFQTEESQRGILLENGQGNATTATATAMSRTPPVIPTRNKNKNPMISISRRQDGFNRKSTKIVRPHTASSALDGSSRGLKSRRSRFLESADDDGYQRLL